MASSYIVKAKKLVTVSLQGTILDGAMVVENGKIIGTGKWEQLKNVHPHLPLLDYSNKVITPSLVDCHTHLLEFAPTSLYPVTKETHFIAGIALLFHALSCGITALGEQICGHPLCDFQIEDYRHVKSELPIDISFAATSISIGFEQLAHFTSVTKSQPVKKNQLTDPHTIETLARSSDYPGENIFINATPANFRPHDVPRAGEIIYSLDELTQIVATFHRQKKEIGTHVAGIEGITLALDAGVDVLHHAHGITDDLIERAAEKKVKIIATPLGGTHLLPNSPEDILKLVKKNITVSIATDAYLPPYQGTSWLPFEDKELKGPETLLAIAHPPMKLLKANGFNENDILALLTTNPAQILGKEKQFGRLEAGMDANFLVSAGIPGLEITEISEIERVYYQGKKVIDRG
ncbi:amidohydrolase family protein [bacterium LRH843]|nr:amidohydrolase family protein [bacterium LRH843]